jgi:hypothetical protein
MSARRSGSSPALLVGAAVVVIGLACGEVPTLPGGIAYISPVILPSPAVALNDTLRDSLGVATPLKLFAIDNAGDTVRTITPLFVVTTIPGPSVHLTPTNLVIGDSIRTAQIVGQVGTRLQTPPASLDVVLQPDSVAAPSGTSARFPAPSAGTVTSAVPLGISVTSPPTAAARAGVKSIIVRYAVTRIFPASASIPDTTLVLIDDNGRFLLPTGRFATDTTDPAGAASRQIRAIPLGFDSVEVSATANNLRGIPLRGSPIRFVVTTK